MPSPRQSSTRKWVRRTCCGIRIGLLSFLLILVVAFLYLNRIGLPDWLKPSLQAQLQSYGFNLDFERLRWRWFRGLVADGVTLTYVRSGSLQGRFREVVMDVDWRSLKGMGIRVRQLDLREGTLVAPLEKTQGAGSDFLLEHLDGRIRFEPDDCWIVDGLKARCLGVGFQLEGRLDHASAMRDWATRTGSGHPGIVWQRYLQRATDFFEGVDLPDTPDVRIVVEGDARDPRTIGADIYVQAREVATTWGRWENLALEAQLNRSSGKEGVARSVVLLDLQRVSTPWLGVGQGSLRFESEQSFTNPVPSRVEWDVELMAITSPWGGSPGIEITGSAVASGESPGDLFGQFTLSSRSLSAGGGQVGTNLLTAYLTLDGYSLIPKEARWELQVESPNWAEAQAANLILTGSAARHPETEGSSGGTEPPWVRRLMEIEAEWQGEVEALRFAGLEVDRLELEGNWKGPWLTVDHLAGDLYEREVETSLRFNLLDGSVEADCFLNFDVHKVAHLLTPKTQQWLSHYGWTNPPKVSAELKATLPRWDGGLPDWRGEVQPTLRIQGEFQGTDATFRGIPIDWAHSHFSYSNTVWHLPDFVGSNAFGSMAFEHVSWNATRDYYFKLQGGMNPEVLRPLADTPNRLKALRSASFSAPLEVQGEIWGRWHEPERTTFRGAIQARDLELRGQPVDYLQADLQVTNGWVNAQNIRLDVGEEWVRVPGIGFRIPDQTLFLTNATAFIVPDRVTQAIGPRTAKTLSPYRFATPVQARADGWVRVREKNRADLRFEVEGGPFQYWQFNLPRVAGKVHWKDDGVAVEEFEGTFYEGRIEGKVAVEFPDPQQVSFRFDTVVHQADLHSLMMDVGSPTNRLEGIFSGDLYITEADAHDWESWQGFGRVQLHDGFLWDIPLVGIFSPVLNEMIPGVGKARVFGAGCNYTIEDSIILTDDLELNSTMFRLAYRGQVDFQQRVKARVEARILKGAWVLGPIISAVFGPVMKLFEYRVTGTLSEPEKELVYIPKPLSYPLQPFSTLRKLFTKQAKE